MSTWWKLITNKFDVNGDSKLEDERIKHGKAEQPNSQQNVLSDQKKFEDPLEMVKEIDEEAGQLELEVDQFDGECQDSKYRYLDEMLTRCMLKLDNIDSKGREDVRNARRTTLSRVDRCIKILEGKVSVAE